MKKEICLSPHQYPTEACDVLGDLLDMDKSTRRSILDVMTSSAWLQSERDKETAEMRKRFSKVTEKPKAASGRRPSILRLSTTTTTSSSKSPPPPHPLHESSETSSKARVRWASFLKSTVLSHGRHRSSSLISPPVRSRDTPSPSTAFAPSKKSSATPQTPQMSQRVDSANGGGSHAEAEANVRFRFPIISSGKSRRRHRTGTELGPRHLTPSSSSSSSSFCSVDPPSPSPLSPPPTRCSLPPSPSLSSSSSSRRDTPLSPASPIATPSSSSSSVSPKGILSPKLPRVIPRVSSTFANFLIHSGSKVECSPLSKTAEEAKDDTEKEILRISRNAEERGSSVGCAVTLDREENIGRSVLRTANDEVEKEVVTSPEKEEKAKGKEKRKKRESQKIATSEMRTGTPNEESHLRRCERDAVTPVGTSDMHAPSFLRQPPRPPPPASLPLPAYFAPSKVKKKKSPLPTDAFLKEAEADVLAESHRKKRRSRRESEMPKVSSETISVSSTDRKVHKTKSIQIAHTAEFREGTLPRPPISAQRPSSKDLLINDDQSVRFGVTSEDVERSPSNDVTFDDTQTGNRKRQRRSASSKSQMVVSEKGKSNLSSGLDDEISLPPLDGDVCDDVTPTPSSSSCSSAQNSYRSPLSLHTSLLSPTALSPTPGDSSMYPLYFPSPDISFSGSYAASPTTIVTPPLLFPGPASSSPSSSVTVIPIFSANDKSRVSHTLSSSSTTSSSIAMGMQDALSLNDLSLSLPEGFGDDHRLLPHVEPSPPSSPLLSSNYDSLLVRIHRLVRAEMGYIEKLNLFSEVRWHYVDCAKESLSCLTYICVCFYFSIVCVCVCIVCIGAEK
jgi:hypothetical protein